MADTEDCQLTDLQSEFKKLRVDFNSLCRNSEKNGDQCCSRSPHCCNKELNLYSSNILQPHKTDCYKVKLSNACLKILAKKKRKKHSAKPNLSEKPLLSETNRANFQPELHGVVDEVHRSVEEQPISGESFTQESYDCPALQQPHADDITVDELAGYFENFVYIPKKMSHMAEMMYT